MSDFQLSDLLPDPVAIARLHVALLHAGLEPALDEHGCLEVSGRDCIVSIECRPRYCDRGRWIVRPRLAPGKSAADLSLDRHDGFPRYYFGDKALVSELRAWLEARGQVLSAEDPGRFEIGDQVEHVQSGWAGPIIDIADGLVTVKPLHPRPKEAWDEVAQAFVPVTDESWDGWKPLSVRPDELAKR